MFPLQVNFLFYKQPDFDVAILDINLGKGFERGGFELAMIAQKCAIQKPIIFLTGYNKKEIVLESSAFAPAAYYVKPVSEITLYAGIQFSIENYRKNIQMVEPAVKETVPNYYFSKIGNKVVKILWNEVLILKHTKNYVIVKSEHAEVLIRGSLTSIFNEFIPEELKSHFVKLNRTSILNKGIILKIENGTVFTTLGEFELTSSINVDDLNTQK